MKNNASSGAILRVIKRKGDVHSVFMNAQQMCTFPFYYVYFFEKHLFTLFIILSISVFYSYTRVEWVILTWVEYLCKTVKNIEVFYDISVCEGQDIWNRRKDTKRHEIQLKISNAWKIGRHMVWRGRKENAIKFVRTSVHRKYFLIWSCLSAC